jgi:D-alanine--poly(phosphoribitol) ligase subunit 2
MTDAEIKDLIRQEITNVAFTEVNDTDALIEQNILDSVGAVDLAVALEGVFGISIPFVDINKQQFHSIETLAAYVRLKKAPMGQDAGT